MNIEPIPRLSRLSAILTTLQSSRLVNATQLSEKFGVSKRTIYRDIRSLEESGVPIHMEEGKGYSLMDGYTLPPIMFSEAEANALITAQQIILQNKDQSFKDEYTNAITKIKAVLRSDGKDKTKKLESRIAYFKNLKGDVSSNNLIHVQSAITNQIVLRIEYVALYDGKKTKRDVEPMAIYHTQENWIMIAWCRMREAFRDFRLDRIEEMDITSTHFEDRDFDLMTYFKSKLEIKY
ncbi:MAG: putative DNA-binding transcriptional regulator YafY [Saprospiraceae bacterium]|jgi:predicted DNA-binding transcriptional regulator YafY